jgi:hypothetical protein
MDDCGKATGKAPREQEQIEGRLILPIECSTHFHLDLKAYCPQTDTDNRQYDNLWACGNCWRVDSRAALSGLLSVFGSEQGLFYRQYRLDRQRVRNVSGSVLAK